MITVKGNIIDNAIITDDGDIYVLTTWSSYSGKCFAIINEICYQTYSLVKLLPIDLCLWTKQLTVDSDYVN